MIKLPLTLATFVKNEEKNIAEMIESVFPIVSEVVVLDTGSTDATVNICKKYTNRIYQVGFTNFGGIRTLAAHLATMPWVLMLDGDERIDPSDWPLFIPLLKQPLGTPNTNYEKLLNGEVVIDSWALPRKRWADKEKTKQVELDAWPDWQVRLFRNHYDKRIGFERRVHERVFGCVRTEKVIQGPIIHHFQTLHKNKKDQAVRRKLYNQLYKADIAEGIAHEEPPIADIDKK